MRSRPRRSVVRVLTSALGRPRWGEAAYSLRRHYVDDFLARHVAELPPRSLVLDVGGDRVRKRGRFDIERYGLRTVYVNISGRKRPHAQADARALPFRSAAFDAAICSELLEHVPAPLAVVREINRVLRPSGVLIGGAPFLYQIHADPDDYARYTATFWRRLLAEAGFNVDTVAAQGGFWSVGVDLVRAFATDGLAGPRAGQRAVRLFLRIVLPVLKRLAVDRDSRAIARRDPFTEAFTTGFGFVAVKAA